MGKSPRLASAGFLVAVLMAAGCQNSPPPVPPAPNTAAWNRPGQSGNFQNGGGANSNVSQNGAAGGMPQNGGTNVAQSGANGATGGQSSGIYAMPRVNTGITGGGSGGGSFQNNFANNTQQGSSFNQNQGTNNVQPASFNQNQGTNNVQPASFNQNQGGGGLQQAVWNQNPQATGASANRNSVRNLDDNSAPYNPTGASGSTPAPVWPKSTSNSSDPPPVAQPAGDVNYINRYQPPLPFTGGRTGGNQ